MARNQGPPPPDEDSPSSSRDGFRRGEQASSRSRSVSPSRYSEDDSPIDATLLDLEPEEQQPFLRAQKRVPVRRGPLPKRAANRLRTALIAIGAVGVIALVAFVFYQYGASSWRFRIDSGDLIEVAGTKHVTRGQIMQVMGGDIGKNVFFISLAERKRKLEEIPWVESASVMRFLPNRVRVEIRERTPVAFVLMGSHIELIDASGVVMDLPAGGQSSYSFPVLVGFSDTEPLSTRAARMKVFMQLMTDLDANGEHRSQELSDVDVTDPDDVKVTVGDPQGAVLVHLGSSNFLERYKVYVEHVQEWRQQFQKLDSVDLRYERQVIVNPDSHGIAPVPVAPAQPKAVAPVARRKSKRH